MRPTITVSVTASDEAMDEHNARSVPLCNSSTNQQGLNTRFRLNPISLADDSGGRQKDATGTITIHLPLMSDADVH